MSFNLITSQDFWTIKRKIARRGKRHLKDVAKEVGVSESTISRIHNNPDFATYYASHLNLNDWLENERYEELEGNNGKIKQIYHRFTNKTRRKEI